jgi:radical SAM protein with 4Fe4S-binding SPASM domain
MSSCKKDTYCPLLWGEVYIDAKGDVYSCCHKKPSALGNIYQEKLHDICNNETIQQWRQKSLDGKLECFEQCTIIDKEKERNAPRKKSFNYLKDLRKLKIEFGELCNIHCVMCWQDHKSKLVLDYKKLIENINLEPFEDIDIQGGEPLAIANAKAYYEYVASQNKRLIFMTNGLLINHEWAEKIVLHSSYIHISLNAATAKTHEIVNKGSQWNTVLKNIAKLKEAREKCGSSMKIIGHMTIVLENVHEIPLFINHFKEFGVDQIDFGYDKNVPGYLKGNPFFKIALKRDIYRAYRMTPDSSLIDLKRLKMLGLI